MSPSLGDSLDIERIDENGLRSLHRAATKLNGLVDALKDMRSATLQCALTEVIGECITHDHVLSAVMGQSAEEFVDHVKRNV